MEHCPHCGARLPEVAYYCPICGKRLEDTTAAETPSEPPSRPIEREPMPPPLPPPPPVRQPRAPESWRVQPVRGVEMLSPALMAGIAGGVVVGVPMLNACGCLWMMGCGALAVYFFHKQFARPALANESAKLGMISGLFGFVVAMVVSFVAHALIRRTPLGLVERLREDMQKAFEIVRPENAQELMDQFNAPGGGAALIIVFATGTLLSFLAFSTLGALIAGALSRRGD